MSEMELAMSLLKNVPSYKIGYVIAYLQGITADEALDDAYCENLCAEYEKEEDKGEFVSLEKMAEMCGVNYNEI